MSRDDAHWSDREAVADLLDAERGVRPPSGSDRRVLDRVLASVAVGAPSPLEALPQGPPPIEAIGGAASPAGGATGAGAAGSAGAAASASAAGAGAAGASLSVSVATGGGGLLAAVLGGTAVGAVALGAWLTLAPSASDPIGQPPATRAVTTPTATEPDPAAVVPEPVAPARPLPHPPAPVAEAATPPTRPAVERRTRRPARAPAPPQAREQPIEEPEAPAVDDALRGELQLLAKARAALAADAPDEALRALADHSRRYPAGRFDQERELLAIRAEMAAGRPAAARARAERFRSAFPSSLHRSTVDALVPPAADRAGGR